MVGCFLGVIFLSLAKAGIFKQTKNYKIEGQIFGMLMIFITSWCFSSVGVITRKLKEVHFSLMMFYYGVFATTVLTMWTIFEYIVYQHQEMRIFNYRKE